MQIFEKEFETNSDVFPLHDSSTWIGVMVLREPQEPLETWSKNIKMKNSLNILVLLQLNF